MIFTRLTTRESIKITMFGYPNRNFGGELLLHLEEDYVVETIMYRIIGKPNVYFSHIPKIYRNK